jgi:hypothetical protein
MQYGCGKDFRRGGVGLRGEGVFRDVTTLISVPLPEDMLGWISPRLGDIVSFVVSPLTPVVDC